MFQQKVLKSLKKKNKDKNTEVTKDKVPSGTTGDGPKTSLMRIIKVIYLKLIYSCDR